MSNSFPFPLCLYLFLEFLFSFCDRIESVGVVWASCRLCQCRRWAFAYGGALWIWSVFGCKRV